MQLSSKRRTKSTLHRNMYVVHCAVDGTASTAGGDRGQSSIGPTSAMPEPSSLRRLRLLRVPDLVFVDLVPDGALGTPGSVVGALPIIALWALRSVVCP